MKKKAAVFIFLVFWGLRGALLPGDNAVKFKHISLDEGLSQNKVYCILQDSRGFLWFGTQDGLNKYDGCQFTVYKPDPDDSSSLSHNTIFTIFEDASGRIWIGTTGGGLNRFDPKKEKFRRFPVPPDSIKGRSIRAICQDKKGAVWIAAPNGGLFKIIPGNDPANPGEEKEKITRYTHTPGDPASLSSPHAISLLVDHSGTLWVGTWGGGLNRFNRETNTFTQFRAAAAPGNDPAAARRDIIPVIYEDRAGRLWVGTAGGGLGRFHRETGTFTYYRHIPGDPGSLSYDHVSAILEDHAGTLWVGTAEGLNRFDGKSRFARFFHSPGDPYSLSSSFIGSIYEDRSHILWIGTMGGGVNKFDRQDKFTHYKFAADNPNSLSHRSVFAIHEDRAGFTWVGTKGGLDRFHRKSGTVTHFRHIPGDPASLPENYVLSLLEDRQGVLWVGTEGGGLAKMNREKGTFTRYRPIPGDPTSIGSSTIRKIFEDSSGALWLAAQGGGINRFNRRSGAFTRHHAFPGELKNLGDVTISSIIESAREPGVLWLGTTSRGLCRFDTRHKTLTFCSANQDDPHSLSMNFVLSIYEDSSGVLWVGTYGGGLNKCPPRGQGVRRATTWPGLNHPLSRFAGGRRPQPLSRFAAKQPLPGNTKTETRSNYRFIHYTEKHGLSNNTVYGILEDMAGNLWLSTNKGLSRFDPVKETFKNYNVKDGVQGSEFNSGAYFKSSSGEMFFGGINGFNAFYPGEVKDNPHIPPIVITGFRIANRPVPIGPDSPLKQAVAWCEELRLTYRQNNISFEFAALDFTIPGKNRYAYKLENYEKDWIFTGMEKRFAYYTGLAPGKYIFRVKGSNNDGVWNEKGAAIRIYIAPPFWATWWFNAALLVLAAVLLVWWYRRRLKNVRIKTELQTAHDAQMSIMPQADPEVENFDISGVCIPAYDVGGDFFDYTFMDEEKKMFAVVVGDVSGKAMKSAMTAVLASGMIYIKAGKSSSLEEIMKDINRSLYFKTEKQVFCVLCLAALDTRSREMVFCNAGLNPPLLKSGGEVLKLAGAGSKLPLGIHKDCGCREKQQQLASGDVVLFFTDGITEARDPFKEFYGHKRLLDLLAGLDTARLTARQIRDRIIEDVRGFSRGAPQHDDITVVVVKVL